MELSCDVVYGFSMVGSLLIVTRLHFCLPFYLAEGSRVFYKEGRPMQQYHQIPQNGWRNYPMAQIDLSRPQFPTRKAQKKPAFAGLLGGSTRVRTADPLLVRQMLKPRKCTSLKRFKVLELACSSSVQVNPTG